MQTPRTEALWGRLNGMPTPSRHPNNGSGQDLGFGLGEGRNHDLGRATKDGFFTAFSDQRFLASDSSSDQRFLAAYSDERFLAKRLFPREAELAFAKQRLARRSLTGHRT
ncbi:hypothetical protein [Mesotoga sp. UBA6090]|uniref:hypothetical protein n=1 Tax=Mesotoga sp. UBA6090 TaxID=1946860 RepID=UPI0025FEBD9F|nr:hypothetical protein [Mesotoga sp. UBA6090]